MRAARNIPLVLTDQTAPVPCRAEEEVTHQLNGLTITLRKSMIFAPNIILFLEINMKMNLLSQALPS